jgi:hypothetical protein
MKILSAHVGGHDDQCCLDVVGDDEALLMVFDVTALDHETLT